MVFFRLTNLNINSGKVLSGIILFLFLCLYLFFPSGFSTLDGWSYAAEIRYSDQLFQPFHLLYNALGYAFCFFPAKAGSDTLACLKVMNSIFGVLSLLVVRMVIRELGKTESVAIMVSCLSGFSFSVIRFATENETYIVPLCLALYSYYFYIRFLRSGRVKHAMLSGLLASFSVLFHLSYVFWWVSIMIGLVLEKKRLPVLSYLSVSLIVPLTYLMAVLLIYGDLNGGSLSDFFLSKFNSSVKFSFSVKGLFFTVVNLGRSFIQVHGYISGLVGRNIFFIVPGILSLVFFTLSFFYLPSRSYSKIRRETLVLILIILFMGLFAMMSEGNAEFMVMIPLLFFIVLIMLFEDYEKFLVRILAGMMIWNISYGLIPLHLSSHETEDYLCEKSAEREKTIVIASDAPLLRSMILYRTGAIEGGNILFSPAMTPHPANLESRIDSALAKGVMIITDCIGVRPVSRASIIEGNVNKEFFNKYRSVQLIAFQTISGKKEVHRIVSR
jgi:hypothetical protein